MASSAVSGRHKNALHTNHCENPSFECKIYNTKPASFYEVLKARKFFESHVLIMFMRFLINAQPRSVLWMVSISTDRWLLCKLFDIKIVCREIFKYSDHVRITIRIVVSKDVHAYCEFGYLSDWAEILWRHIRRFRTILNRWIRVLQPPTDMQWHENCVIVSKKMERDRRIKQLTDNAMRMHCGLFCCYSTTPLQFCTERRTV